jgi:phosphosulfolactate phosphohydrolase-like enzyme
MLWSKSVAGVPITMLSSPARSLVLLGSPQGGLRVKQLEIEETVRCAERSGRKEAGFQGLK